MENNIIIEVRNLKIQFGENIILQDVNFTVRKGEIFAIIGGSGSGKTVLLKHLIGLLESYNGNIYIESKDLKEIKKESYDIFLNKIGVAFQYGALLGSLTLAENIMLPLMEYKTDDEAIARRIAAWKLSLVDLKGFDNYYPSDISGGMKKRASIARAIALNPKILFLDEPTSGLDPITSTEIDNLIKRLNKNLGTTIILVTHDIESVFSTTNSLILLDGSKKTIIAKGHPFDVFNNNDRDVQRFFERVKKSTIS
ncbi:MAG: ATP-binding cassette domain-containing protein [Deferribacterota bacterium]|nr:ATP-binding cassette domain-containing protein [Deferribacterota bacterium]